MSPMGLGRLLIFQAVWLACAIGAARGHVWPGLAAAGGLVVLHLVLSERRPAAAVGLLAAGLLGALAESLLARVGLVVYAAPWPTPTLAPAWIVALWVAFAATLEPTRRLLGRHAGYKAGALGLAFGPLSYVAGEKLGALHLLEPAWRGWLATGLLWAMAFPALLALDGRLGSPRDGRTGS